jgi:NADH-quinone oxidoreductase subunit L
VTRTVLLVPLFPLLAVLANLFAGKHMPRRAVAVLACGAVGASFMAALWATMGLLSMPAAGRAEEFTLYQWIGSGPLSVPLGVLFDPLSAVMILVVTGVGFLIHLYAVGYMHGDPGFARFFLFLNLFVFAMLVLVLGNSYLLLFVGWEGVGLASWLLIGFWFRKDSAAAAGRKAFVVNRVGDFGFLLGMLLLICNTGTLTFTEVFTRAPAVFAPGGGMVLAICLLLFVGAMGKSAQFPLHVWLPDAMEGPTPVSALIHAATMVTAGVYLVCRSHLLFSLAPAALGVVAAVGLFTAFFAATIALVQNDIKRVLAYSTVSQLGFMFLAAGVGAFGAAVFHLVTHAFFKALLFLGAGSVIHGMNGEQDIRRMGGLRRKMPATYRTFLVGTAAIAGIPPLAGFFSKDEILYSTFTLGGRGGGGLLWLAGILTALMTAFYMFRLLFRVFHGPEGEGAGNAHESPRVMTVPLAALAALSAVGGALGLPLIPHANLLKGWFAPLFGEEGAAVETILGSRLEGSAGGHVGGMSLEIILMLASVAAALGGLALAFHLVLRSPALAERLAGRTFPGLYRMMLAKWKVDEFYDRAVVRPIYALARFCWSVIDVAGIDGAVNGVARLCGRAGGTLRRAQTGLTGNYALAMAVGLALMLLYALLRGFFPGGSVGVGR